jgi:hypothetical protein
MKAIIAVFDLWPQYQAQLDRQADDPRRPPGAPGGTQGTGDLAVRADVAGTGEPHSPPGGDR